MENALKVGDTEGRGERVNDSQNKCYRKAVVVNHGDIVFVELIPIMPSRKTPQMKETPTNGVSRK